MLLNPPVHYRGIRFALNAKDSLVSWINLVNHRSFSSDDFVFDDPTNIQPNGWVTVTGTFLPTNESITLTLQRVDLSEINSLRTLSFHTPSFSKESIANSIFEQYGIYLDLDLFELDLEKQELSSVLGDRLNGFGDTGLAMEAPIFKGTGEATGKIYISPRHLTLEGTIDFKIRTSMLSLGLDIDSVLKLRDYYSISDESKPFVETLQPKGVWTVDKNAFSPHHVKKEIDARLYESTLYPDIPVDYDFIKQVLTAITGHAWSNVMDTVPFNVMGSTIKYNGVSGKHPNIAPVEYSYLMIIELGTMCSNLQGDIHIAYQYVNELHPLYGNKTLAGAPTL